MHVSEIRNLPRPNWPPGLQLWKHSSSVVHKYNILIEQQHYAYTHTDT